MTNQNTTNIFSLETKTVFITKASKGIGLAIGHAYFSLGAQIVISSRDEEEIEKQARKIDSLHILYKKCQVGFYDELTSLVDFTIKNFSKIEIIGNNLSINPVFSPVSSLGVDVFDKIKDIYVEVPFLLSNLVYNIMCQHGGRSIIHNSSVEGKRPNEGLEIYSVSKAALIMLAKTQAKEWGKTNIRVNTILAGLVKTKFNAIIWQNEDFLEQWNEQVSMHRMAEPNEIIGLAVFLASDSYNYCTGGEFAVDGGYLN
ncbi:MAG: SDR family oxidoreductase [Saprospiraceae bacterium]